MLFVSSVDEEGVGDNCLPETARVFGFVTVFMLSLAD